MFWPAASPVMKGHLHHAGEILDISRQYRRVEGECPDVIQRHARLLLQEAASFPRCIVCIIVGRVPGNSLGVH
jgi:hypothetical protein